MLFLNKGYQINGSSDTKNRRVLHGGFFIWMYEEVFEWEDDPNEGGE